MGVEDRDRLTYTDLGVAGAAMAEAEAKKWYECCRKLEMDKKLLDECLKRGWICPWNIIYPALKTREDIEHYLDWPIGPKKEEDRLLLLEIAVTELQTAVKELVASMPETIDTAVNAAWNTPAEEFTTCAVKDFIPQPEVDREEIRKACGGNAELVEEAPEPCELSSVSSEELLNECLRRRWVVTTGGGPGTTTHKGSSE